MRLVGGVRLREPGNRRHCLRQGRCKRSFRWITSAAGAAREAQGRPPGKDPPHVRRRSIMVKTMLAAVLLVLPALAPVRESDPKPVTPPSEEAVKKWGKGDVLVLADLTSAREGPSLPTNPPQYNTALALKVNEPLRGALKKDDTASGNLRTTGVKPTLTVGKKHLVAAIEELTDDNLKDARAVAAMPRGWSVEGKEFVSPWAALGRKAWPKGLEGKSAIRCARTGRPALLVGDEIEFSVEKVPPAREIKFQNPDGDGEYKITLKNPTRKDVKIPALFTDGDKVLWDESVVIVCQGKAYPAPGAAGLPEKAKPVELKAGESISGTVNALRLEGPQWPRGGYRIEFLFCLGEKASNQSFYYYSKHHDAIRAALGAK